MPFLTLEDPRARIKGSRDPLGTQPVWAAFGRKLVFNLTTVTTSVRNFTVHMLGRYWTGRLVEDGRIAEDRVLQAFLLFEQVAAYVRYDRCKVREEDVGERWSSDDVEIRGINRVSRRVDADRRRIPIGHDAEALILTDQKTYGLWGLYTVAARTSGFVPEHRNFGVTERAQEFIDQCYAPHLERGERELLRLIERGGNLDLRRETPHVAGLARILGPEFTHEERSFYGDLLRDGVKAPGSRGRQRVLRELLEEHLLDNSLGRQEVLALAKAATAREEHGLATRLRKVACLEALLAPSAALFDALLLAGSRTPSDVAGDVADRWGRSVPHLDRREFEEIIPEIQATVGDEIAGAMDTCHEALADANYLSAIEALLLWNRLVMAGRKSGSWVALGTNGRLDVRYRNAEHHFPSGDELPDLWRNNYFVNSLKRVTRQLQEPAA